MEKKLTAILVEDENLARERLKRMLLNHGDMLEIIGEATDGKEGVALINGQKPDLVFLDVQMPLMDGFEMLRQLEHQPYIIFTTAFDQYAIKAFEENSMDYLLKPIGKERLQKSIEKLKKLQKHEHDQAVYAFLQKQSRPRLNTIPINVGNKIVLLKVEDIAYFFAEEKYVWVYDAQNNRHLISHSLKELEQELPEHFIRVHRAYILNANFISEIQKTLKGRLKFLLKFTNEAIISSHSYTPSIRKHFRL